MYVKQIFQHVTAGKTRVANNDVSIPLKHNRKEQQLLMLGVAPAHLMPCHAKFSALKTV